VAGKLLAFQEEICTMEFVCCLVKNTIPYEGAEIHAHTHKHTDCRNKIHPTAVKFNLKLNKFRGKDGKWSEHIRQLEEGRRPLQPAGK
jgi:hypothetical protein